MSPDSPNRTKKAIVSSNLYTVILAVAVAVVLATAAFVAFKCKTQYGTLFGAPQKPSSLRSPRIR